MKNYDGLNYSREIYMIKVSLQEGAYEGIFTYQMGGNCKGAKRILN